MPTNDERVWTTRELADLARVTPATVRRWVKVRRIAPVSPLLPGRFGRAALQRLGLLGVADRPSPIDVKAEIARVRAAMGGKR